MARPSNQPPTPSMVGKTCVVTGATSGVGEATAEALARAGASVVLISRSRQKCEDTAARIRAATGNPDVRFLTADLSVQAEVRRVAAELLATAPRIDVLVNNAGAMFEKRQESADGIEMTWALNHLAYFLLTNLLIDRLKASAPARAVNVASDAHRPISGIDWDDVEGKARYRVLHAYMQSKLANILFTRELARRLEGSGVTANALHPGFVWTSIFENKGWVGFAFKLAARVFSITPEAGASNSVYLATSPDVAGVSGRYFEKCKEAKASHAARDAQAAERVWALSERMTGLADATPA